MTCSFVRFVLHYKDGDIIEEERRIPDFWDRLPDKKDIIALGVKYDPLVLNERDQQGKRLRLNNVPQQLILRGSARHNYRFFQYKTGEMQVGASKNRRSGKHEVNLTIGMVVDNKGNCIILEAMPDVMIRTYYTTVHDLRLNLDLFEIKLEEIE